MVVETRVLKLFEREVEPVGFIAGYFGRDGLGVDAEDSEVISEADVGGTESASEDGV